MTDRPDPPAEIAQYILDGLNRQNAEKLRIIATYAEDLAEWRDRTAPEEESEDTTTDDQEAVDRERDDDRPEGVPGKATIVTKTIDGRDYYYWQWHEQGTTKSQYKAPVNPKRSNE